MNKWPIWRRAVFINATVLVGAVVGLASSGAYARYSPNIVVPVCTFILAIANLMFLDVVPRMTTLLPVGVPKPNPWSVLYDVLSEKPLVTILLVIQLIGTSTTAAATISVLQASMSDYVRSLPNAALVSQRLDWSSVALAAVAFLWLLSAIGVWRGRLWAWWVAFALDGLAATTSLLLQFATTILHLGEPSGFLLDLPCTVAVVLLLLPGVRANFRKSSHQTASVPAGSLGGA